MGIRSAFKLLEATRGDGWAANGPAFGARSPIRGIVSPWQPQGQLTQIAWQEIFGSDLNTVSRGMAMTIPAVAKARQILTTQVARFPLRAYRDAARVEPQPAWTYRTDSRVSPWHRMVWTVDDLIFYGWSLWAVERDTVGSIISVDRVPVERWKVNGDREILVDDELVDDDSIILIPGPFEGLLAVGSRTLLGGARLERSWIGKAENPVPIVELHETGLDELSREEAEELVADFLAAREDPKGVVAYTPNRVQVITHGQSDPAMFIEARNALRIDVGGILGIPAALMDASLSTASLTYSTQEGQRNEFADFTLPYWMGPIEAQLSQDDTAGGAVPRGQRIRFDLSELYTTAPSPTGPEVPD